MSRLRHAAEPMSSGHCLRILLALIGSLLLTAPVQAEPRGGQRWERQSESMGGWRERREAMSDRREERRERLQQLTPDERQQIQERRRMRQMSPEERQRLRRDILEANRGLGDGRRP